MNAPARNPRSQKDESKVSVALVVEGDPERAEAIRKQVEHYAQSLDGVRVA